jgi:hypothetical protein
MGPSGDDRAALEVEHTALQAAARERRSVDHYARAALEGFAWAILAGVSGKLFYDSERPPRFLWPLVALDLFLLWDAARAYLRGRSALGREASTLARLREVRALLGIDVAADAALPLSGAARAGTTTGCSAPSRSARLGCSGLWPFARRRAKLASSGPKPISSGGKA